MNFYTKFKKLPTFVLETLSQQDQIILNEIVNLKRTSVDLDPDQVKVVSSGAFGGGSVDVNDPHIFNKITHRKTKLKKDPYYQYVKHASKFVKSNPFFPRVYNVNITDPDDSKRPTYKIESLIHIQELNNSQIVAVGRTISKQLGKKLFDFYDDFRQMPNFLSGEPVNQSDDDDEESIKHTLIKMVTKELKNIIQNDDEPTTDVNPKLLQVAKLIRFLKIKYHFFYDIHQFNYMVRMTPFGPQIVITDPLA